MKVILDSKTLHTKNFSKISFLVIKLQIKNKLTSFKRREKDRVIKFLND